MVNFRKFFPILIPDILMQASILKTTKDNNKNTNQMVLKKQSKYQSVFHVNFLEIK